MNTNAKTPAPARRRMSFVGTCSFLAKSEANQKRMAPPSTRNETRSMPSMPCSMASLPTGAIRPQNVPEHTRQRCAMIIFLSISCIISEVFFLSKFLPLSQTVPINYNNSFSNKKTAKAVFMPLVRVAPLQGKTCANLAFFLLTHKYLMSHIPMSVIIANFVVHKH